jgi:prevent-host-death family protein
MDQTPSTQIVPASEARQKFGELIKQVYSRRSRVIVEKGGIPVIALVALPDLERWTRMDQERDDRFKVLEEIRARNADKTAEEVERDVAEELVALRRDKHVRQAS